jgi:Holliday junction resolvase RusA-like endonuclease|tara:strand:- start:13 stop:378 length:366 start_codon:yes stop_codon:yes gene_type:complete
MVIHTESLRRFILPYPPSLNTYYRYVNGRVLISRKGRAYKEIVAHIMRHMSPSDHPIELNIEMHPPDRRRRDVDNVLKCLVDSAEGHAYRNDSQIRKLTIEKFDPVEGGRIIMEIFEKSDD